MGTFLFCRHFRTLLVERLIWVQAEKKFSKKFLP